MRIADDCPDVDSKGYKVTTSLDWKMQQMAEKWKAAAAIAPNIKGATARAAYLKKLGIPYQAWIRNLVGRGVFNSALAAFDYRTGQVMAYVGSAGYYAKPRGKKLQPQFDVLSDGWRQPGSSFKPINYITGLDDHTKTAASLYMDVVTNFGGGYTPGDADLAERGPLRMREAINCPSTSRPSRTPRRSAPTTSSPRPRRWASVQREKINPAGVSIGIGTLELHYADLISAYGAIANGGVLMPRTFILPIKDSNGKVVYPRPGAKPEAGQQVVSPQAAYVMTDILAGNTDPAQNPFWSERKITDGGRRRPATLKTGTTNDQIDLAAMGYLAPPEDPKAPALVVGAWMGNSDNSIPPDGTMALESAATLWQAFLNQASHGTPIADFKKPPGIVRVASTPTAACCRVRTPIGPSPSTSSRVPSRTSATTPRSAWRSTRRPACCGRTAARARGHQGVPRPDQGRRRLPELADVRQRLDRPGPARSRRPGRPEAHPHRLLQLRRRVVPVRCDLGRAVRADQGVHARTGADADAVVRPDLRLPATERCRRAAVGRHRSRCVAPTGDRSRSRRDVASAAVARVADGRRVRGPYQRRMMVAPSPPSPRSPGRTSRASGLPAASVRTASRRAPVPRPWMIVTRSRPASDASSR